jgi:hypothetical protein
MADSPPDASDAPTQAGVRLPDGARTPPQFEWESALIPAFQTSAFVEQASDLPFETEANLIVGAGSRTARVPALVQPADGSHGGVLMEAIAPDGDMDHEFQLFAPKEGRKVGPLWLTRFDEPERDGENRLVYGYKTRLGPVLGIEVESGTRGATDTEWPALPGVPPRGTPVTVSYTSTRSGNPVSRTGIIHEANTFENDGEGNAEGGPSTMVSIRTDEDQRTVLVAPGADHDPTPTSASPPPVEATVASITLDSGNPNLDPSPSGLAGATAGVTQIRQKTRLGQLIDIESGDRDDAQTLYDTGI